MSAPSFRFDAELKEWDGPAAWYFVLLPDDVADEIADQVDGRPRAGFGSVKVEVTVGRTSWRTSVFPSKSARTYLLPMKKAVRDAEGLVGGSRPSLVLRVVE